MVVESLNWSGYGLGRKPWFWPAEGTQAAIDPNSVWFGPAIVDELRVYAPRAVIDGPQQVGPTPTTPPVTALSASLRNGAVSLAWSRPTATPSVIVRRSLAGGPAPWSIDEGLAAYSGSASRVTVGGLANGGLYRFSVFAMSATGVASAPVSRAASPAVTPSPSPAGSAMGAMKASGPRFRAIFGKVLPAGQSYEIQVGARKFAHAAWNSPVWAAAYTGRATSRVMPSRAGVTYYLRGRVRDSFGNVTPWNRDG